MSDEEQYGYRSTWERHKEGGCLEDCWYCAREAWLNRPYPEGVIERNLEIEQKRREKLERKRSKNQNSNRTPNEGVQGQEEVQ